MTKSQNGTTRFLRTVTASMMIADWSCRGKVRCHTGCKKQGIQRQKIPPKLSLDRATSGAKFGLPLPLSVRYSPLPLGEPGGILRELSRCFPLCTHLQRSCGPVQNTSEVADQGSRDIFHFVGPTSGLSASRALRVCGAHRIHAPSQSCCDKRTATVDRYPP